MQALKSLFHSLAIGAALASLSAPIVAANFEAQNLVTDDQLAHPAQILDPNLKNAWGLSYAPKGPFWLSSNGTGTSPLYKVDGVTQATTKQGLVVSIPGNGSVTGQVFNSNSAAALCDRALRPHAGWAGRGSAWVASPRCSR